MADIKAIELDMVIEAGTEDGVIAEVYKWLTDEAVVLDGVKVSVTTMNGPGGGWPIVRFESSNPELLRRIMVAYDS